MMIHARSIAVQLACIIIDLIVIAHSFEITINIEYSQKMSRISFLKQTMDTQPTKKK